MSSIELSESIGSAVNSAARRRKRSILEFFPYPEIRPQQREILLEIEKAWDTYDVFVIVAPTALGKSAISLTIGKWAGNASILTPTNMLVRQFSDEFETEPGTFPTVGKLLRRSLYTCPRVAEGRLTCEDAVAQYGGTKKMKEKLGCSRDCEYIRDLGRARGRGVGIYNYYTYLAHKLYRPVLIADEAHGLINVIQDLSSAKLWRHKYRYPPDMWNYSDVVRWVEGLESRDQLLDGLLDEVRSTTPRYVIKRDREMWNMCSPPEERELLKMLPIDVADAPPHFWPSRVRKIVLMSATISRKDIESLGLSKRRVLYLESDSPIPVERRPVISVPVAKVNRGSMTSATEGIAAWIEENMLPRYQGCKGVIHATYSQAKMFRERWSGNDRFIFHGKTDTAARYRDFLESPPESGRVLVASGMYEGLDLVDDLGRWQVIAKIPYPSLGDPAIEYKMRQDQEWYTWQALKLVMQGCGRISRRETDFGETYVLDSSFRSLYSSSLRMELVPGWFRSAVQFREADEQ